MPTLSIEEQLTGNYVQDSELNWHYDPNSAFLDCRRGSRTIVCPAQIQLNFFTIKNLIGVILLIIILYIIQESLKKKQKKKTKVVKKTKNKSMKKKVNSKNKTRKK